MKDIKDYIHLYIGCEVLAPYPETNKETRGLLTGMTQEYEEVEMQFVIGYHAEEHPEWVQISDVTILLRPLPDITDEEAIYVKRILRDNHGIDTIKTVLQNGWHLGHLSANASQMFQITQYLLSKGFDLFDLIPAGLAIDKTTLKQKV